MNAALSEQLGVSAGSTFYGFAEQCIKWAKNARSMQERAAYMDAVERGPIPNLYANQHLQERNERATLSKLGTSDHDVCTTNGHVEALPQK